MWLSCFKTLIWWSKTSIKRVGRCMIGWQIRSEIVNCKKCLLKTMSSCFLTGMNALMGYRNWKSLIKIWRILQAVAPFKKRCRSLQTNIKSKEEGQIHGSHPLKMEKRRWLKLVALSTLECSKATACFSGIWTKLPYPKFGKCRRCLALTKSRGTQRWKRS